MKNDAKRTKEPLFHLVKRTNVPMWQACLIRVGAILVGLLVIMLLCLISLDANPGFVFKFMLKGAFGVGEKTKLMKYKTLSLMRDLAILLLFALAVTPAFKMKFWNIGAEGQVLIAALSSMVCIFYLGGKVNNVLLIFICLVAAVTGGVIWAVIPALFKAKWNTNETLFTLMMNYVAIELIVFMIKVWVPSGSQSLPPSQYANLPKIGGDDFWFSIIVALVATAFMFTYLRFTKHGYEISVVGESEKTARYIGINVKKVILRTLLVSGIICGITGFLLVNGKNHTVSDTSAGGRGFTAILVSWLAKFNPLFMILTAFLVVFLEKGTEGVMDELDITNDFFSQVLIGVMFLLIIACEFFINYKVVFRHRAASAPTQGAPALEEGEEAKAFSEELDPDPIVEASGPFLSEGAMADAEISQADVSAKEE